MSVVLMKKRNSIFRLTLLKEFGANQFMSTADVLK